MVAWPSATIPNSIVHDGFSMTLADNVIQSQPDIGPPKRRRRTTANVIPITRKFLLDGTQYTAFDSFYENDLESGSLPFDWVHPMTGAAVSCAFKSPPKIGPIVGYKVWVTIEYNILP